MSFTFFAAAAALIGAPVNARVTRSSDCSGVHNYPFMVAITELQNAGKLRIADVDFRTSKSEVIATRQVKRNLQRQVLRLDIRTRNAALRAMVINYASPDECSMPGTKVYLLTEVR